MKYSLIIALTLMTGCEEPIRATDTKKGYSLPSGILVFCENARVWTNSVTLEGCSGGINPLAPSGNIKCSQGVCWEHK